MKARASDEQSGSGDTIDPATERLRRKLVRFMAINLVILGFALMAVLAIIVYRSMTPAENAGDDFQEGRIVLPAGTEVLSHALSGSRILIDARLQDGTRTLFVYDITRGTLVGRFSIVSE